MFADEIRCAAQTALRSKLPEVLSIMWKAFGEGHLTEGQAEELSALIEARRVVSATGTQRRSAGSRPRSPASIERRRRWAASGAMPVGLASRFSIAEQAALAVVAGEVMKHGRCTLFIGHIAALAGVSETSVRNALREAKQLGLVVVEIRRVTAWRNDANVVTIVSAEWNTWLSRGGRGGGYKSVKGSDSNFRSESGSGRNGGEKQTGYRGSSSLGGQGSYASTIQFPAPEKAAQAPCRHKGYFGAVSPKRLPRGS